MSIRREVITALREAGRPMLRAELIAHVPSCDGDEKRLAQNLYEMRGKSIVESESTPDGLEYRLGENAHLVPTEPTGDAPPQPSRKARAPRSRPAAKRTPRNQERKAPPVKRSRTRRATPKTRIILAAAGGPPIPDRAATARDLAAGVVGNVASSVELLIAVLDSELEQTTPTIAAALAQVKAAVSLCQTGLSASGGGA